MSTERSALLRRALAANAAFSGATGLALLLFAVPLGRWIALEIPWLLRALGGALSIFAGSLVLLVRRKRPGRRQVLAVCVSDFGWVAGSAVLLAGFPGVLSAAGLWTVGAVAVAVGALGTAQLVGLRRAA